MNNQEVKKLIENSRLIKVDFEKTECTFINKYRILEINIYKNTIEIKKYDNSIEQLIIFKDSIIDFLPYINFLDWKNTILKQIKIWFSHTNHKSFSFLYALSDVIYSFMGESIVNIEKPIYENLHKNFNIFEKKWKTLIYR